ncbi:MAG: glycosyltransferase [Candidatus Competibacteraceae bacterium]
MTAPSGQEFVDIASPSPQSAAAKHIALFVRTMEGGVGRKFLHLAKAFAKRGHRVDVLVLQAEGPYLKELPAAIQAVILDIAPDFKTLPVLLRLPKTTRRLLPLGLLSSPPRMIRALPALKHYLQKEKPDILLAAIEDAGIVALWAKWLAGVPTRVVVKNVAAFSQQLLANATKLFECVLPMLIQQWYPQADGIIAVSNGAADDLAQVTGLSRQLITTIYNPLDLDLIANQATQTVADSWLLSGQPPVLIAVGRLEPQKDYPTLLRAFAQLRKTCAAYLIIMGEGNQRPLLEALCRELGIAADVRLPGFVNNPYSYMARAAVLVLSSAWEGFPNVLLEALACGCPVVSTNCPSGPDELLAGGVYGRLVPVSDYPALAQAILETLAAPRESEKLLQRARLFSLDTVVDQYLQILLGCDATTVP